MSDDLKRSISDNVRAVQGKSILTERQIMRLRVGDDGSLIIQPYHTFLGEMIAAVLQYQSRLTALKKSSISYLVYYNLVSFRNNNM